MNAVRLFARPGLPVTKTSVGFQIAFDASPSAGLSETTDLPLIDNAAEADPFFTGVALDTTVPILNNRNFSLAVLAAAGG